MTPGEQLKQIMKANDIGQIQLAEAAGVAQSSINRMKNNKQELNYKVLKYLRAKYRVDINLFFD